MTRYGSDDIETIERVTGTMFRLIREDNGLDLHQVAGYLEVTAECVEAHEGGAKPLSSARLYQAGLLFGVKISAFFQPFYYPERYESQE